MNLKKYDIVYDESITSWDEGLPLGNGRLGALIYGDGPLRVAIDRIDIWDNRPKPGIFAKDYNYQNLRRLVLASSKNDDPAWQECQRIFKITLNHKTPYPTKLTPGRMELDFGGKFVATSRVCLQTLLSRGLPQSPTRRQLPPGGSLSSDNVCASIAIQTHRQIKI